MTKLRGRSGPLIRGLAQLFRDGTCAELPEGELVQRFVAERDETAFTTLIARHGPMVLGVCRQLLRDPNDVDDAFQATFLVMVRKASSLRRSDLLGNWLYGVATRIAAKTRTNAARRTARFTSARDVAEVDSNGWHHGSGSREADGVREPWLHEEVGRLPEKYRVPVVLCYFEGLTHEQAAASLGWPVGSVKGRLARARELLRRRLTRRGLALSSVALVSQLALPDAKSAVPLALESGTLKAAQALVVPVETSLAVSGAVSPSVMSLVQGVLHAMALNQLKSIVLPLLLVSGTVATGVVVGAAQLSPGRGTAEIATGGVGPQSALAQGYDRAPQNVLVKKGVAAAPATADPRRDEQDAFDKLLSALQEIDSADIERLSQWSSLTAKRDLLLADTPAKRRAAREAHRDRMKKLHERTQQIPVSDSNQPRKADEARSKLTEAQALLDGETKSSGGMARMVGMMAAQQKMMMGAMGGAPTGMPGMMGAMAPAQAKKKAAAKAAVAKAGQPESAHRRTR